MPTHKLPVENEVSVASWDEYEVEIQKLNRYREEANRNEGPKFREPWYRGMANFNWGMQTTLERSHPSESSTEYTSVKRYYEKALAAKAVVETFTNRRWDRIPEVNEFERALDKHWSGLLRDFLVEQPEVFEYLIYLRHHGFPSPLLDWTASPYVALFFAFDDVPKDTKYVAVYALLESSIRATTSDENFFMVGRYLRTHQRHYLQQANYSMCVRLKLVGSGKDFLFSPHEPAMARAVGKDGKLIKYKIPVHLRTSVLIQLDRMNINAFSLFGSDEALNRTVARRELLFHN
jgi:hypothetical protein